MLEIKKNQQMKLVLKSEVIKYPDNVEEKVVLDKIEELNKDADCFWNFSSVTTSKTY